MTAQLAHDVYFTLEDRSPEACRTLVAECHTRLAGIDGIVCLAAGTRDTELERDVNDRDYDVLVGGGAWASIAELGVIGK